MFSTSLLIPAVSVGVVPEQVPCPWPSVTSRSQSSVGNKVCKSHNQNLHITQLNRFFIAFHVFHLF